MIKRRAGADVAKRQMTMAVKMSKKHLFAAASAAASWLLDEMVPRLPPIQKDNAVPRKSNILFEGETEIFTSPFWHRHSHAHLRREAAIRDEPNVSSASNENSDRRLLCSRE